MGVENANPTDFAAVEAMAGNRGCVFGLFGEPFAPGRSAGGSAAGDLEGGQSTRTESISGGYEPTRPGRTHIHQCQGKGGNKGLAYPS